MRFDPGGDSVIFDVDGTLAEFDAARLGHLVHGSEKRWGPFFEAMADAPPVAPVRRLAQLLAASGLTILICSGRPRAWEGATRDWLVGNEVPHHAVYLRPDNGHAWSDATVKRYLLDAILADGHRPWLVVDDRSSVVAFWRSAGLTCLQCAEGDF